MDSNFPSIRSDVVAIPTVARPTPTPTRVSFGDVLTKGASTLASGAEAAMEVLPGGPLIAAAVRGGLSVNAARSSTMMSGGLSSMTTAEGPLSSASVGGGFGASAASGAASSTGVPTGSIDSSLQQSQEMNLYFLQIQQEVNTQSETFSTLSNVMKTESDTVKNAIGNLH